MGILATGEYIISTIVQSVVIIALVIVYAPFIVAYERQQNKEAAHSYLIVVKIYVSKSENISLLFLTYLLKDKGCMYYKHKK
jgi:hypothetical protein